MKRIIILFIFLSSFVYSQQSSILNNSNQFLRYSLQSELKSQIMHTRLYEGELHSPDFLNNNLDFSTSSNSFNSGLKLTAEITTGALSGYGCAILFKKIFEPDNSQGENWLGVFWQAAMIGVGAALGTSGGTFLMGNVLGDEGSFKNTLYWSILSSSVFHFIGRAFTKDTNNRLLIAMIGLPVGAAIGFNSHELF